MPEMKEWTLMFYFASDNPLASTIVSQLKAIKDAGFHQDANVIAYFDPQTKNTPSHVFDVNMVDKLKRPKKTRFSFTANDPFVRNLVYDKLWAEADKDTQDLIQASLKKKYHIDNYDPPPLRKEMCAEQDPQDSLNSFLALCAEKYQARHYMLFILGHGVVVGNDIFLLDENIPEFAHPSGVATPLNDGANPKPQRANANSIEKKPAGHSLTLSELGTELETFKAQIDLHGGKLELVGLHSCSMSGLEVAYEIQGKANYLLASQGPAFVGSWPYKQILMRVFNDLDSVSFKTRDFEFASLIAKLKQADNQYLTGLFKDTSLLLQDSETNQLHSALTQELNGLLENPDLHLSDWASRIQLSKRTEKLKNESPEGVDLMWLNRMLLQDAFKAEIHKRKRKPEVKRMLTKIFSYCISNSYDYLLAGYSFDMALCDLSKLKDEKKGLTGPLKKLISALGEGLNEKNANGSENKNGPAQEPILLAHWDAQSFWQEQYIDLYDFCFRLRSRCKAYEETNPTLKEIRAACLNVMKVLTCGKEKKRGEKNDDDRLIVRSAFIGPAYQYSHGLSVFFPWSEPVDESFMKKYKEYAFTKDFISKNDADNDDGSWLGILKTYFEATIRGLRNEEKDEEIDDVYASQGARKPKDDDLTEEELLDLLKAVSNSVFSNDGQLSKAGSHDPAGADCDCSSIKNYPSFTRRHPKAGEPEPRKRKNLLFSEDVQQIAGI